LSFIISPVLAMLLELDEVLIEEVMLRDSR
jgi:hypothetical protein